MVEHRRKRDRLQAHYTTCSEIVDFMVSRLQCETGHNVLEPCAGTGHFVDALLLQFPALAIDCYEIDAQAAYTLKTKYADAENVRVKQCDFVLESKPSLFSTCIQYDRVIGNPPYGAWQDPSRRAELRAEFPGLYVRETYGLFFHRCIELLKPGGRLVFIVPDTFLHLRLHEGLRRYILSKTQVEEIASFPSRFFPGISFGYANLAIVTLRRISSDCATKSITIAHGFQTPRELVDYSRSAPSCSKVAINKVVQDEIKANHSAAFVHWKSDLVLRCERISKSAVGDVATVVTGFYSGDDRKYLRAGETARRAGKAYGSVASSMIYQGDEPPLEGISGSRQFIPFVKGGGQRYLKRTEWFVDWSKEAVHEYRVSNRKKARFQNSEYYFREGIAVPMVSSKSVTAALLQRRLFDQSIVGIFPNDNSLLNVMLGFFNSKICTRLLREINPSANNSANYVKRIPFVVPNTAQLAYADCLVAEIIERIRTNGIFDESLQAELDQFFAGIYGLTTERLLEQSELIQLTDGELRSSPIAL